MSVVLGINAYHAGASAALVLDGTIRFAIAEERLNRRKYYAGFPERAIAACLASEGLRPQDIDVLAVGRDSGANLARKLAYVARHPLLMANMLKIRASRRRLDDLRGEIARHCAVDASSLRFRQLNVEHHLAHTASAFHVSGFEHAAGITIDGSGDFVTCMMSRCAGRDITPVQRIFVPDSLGSFYSMVCQFIGYRKYGDEGKVMGLAPLGTDRYAAEFREMVRFESGQIVLSRDHFLPFGSDQGITITDEGEMVLRRHYSDLVVERFGPPREPDSEISQRDMDLAFGLQKRFEEIYFELLNHLHSQVPERRVVMAGGCALNSVANGKVFERTPFIETSIQPAAGDEGLALGAALHAARAVLGEGEPGLVHHAYLGGEYGESVIEPLLRERKVQFRRLGREDLIEMAASAIEGGAVVGWFQGRSEWGPRALGNRSILCHPGFPGMKDILNARIKKREWFRPFAPVVLAERQSEIFEQNYPSPYMLHVFRIREPWRERLSAVNHVDDTGRLQTLVREHNPLYYDLIKAFERRTGIPVLLNTSFNENEPIVEHPLEAIDCFLRTRMDALVAGPFFCSKPAADMG